MSDLNKWSAFLDALVPSGAVEIEDVTGATHRVASRLPAEVETRVIRVLRRIDLSGVSVDDLAGGVDAFADLVTREGLLDDLAEAFLIAHPRAVTRARANVDRGIAAGDDFLADLGNGPEHLFSLGAMVAALLPFAVATLRSMLRTLEPISDLGAKSTS